MSLLLLDTHAWLWFALGNEKRLGPQARAHIEQAAKDGALWLSAISIWEVSLLEAKGRLHMGMAVEEWMKRALKLPGLQQASLDLTIILDSHRLPGKFHSDPADQIIVATARHLKATLVTADQPILRYAKLDYLKAMNAER